jgi:hypothetical protein
VGRATDYSGELSISDEILKRVVEAYRRIRNTLRFLLANTADFDPGRDMLPVEQWLEIDRYALAMTRQLQAQCEADYERFEFHRVVQSLQTFCSEDLGGFYLDILKDRLYTTAAGSPARRSAQSALWHILQSFVKLMAPILSFTAEEIWQLQTGDGAVGDAADLAAAAGAGRRRPNCSASGARSAPIAPRSCAPSKNCASPARSARRCRPRSACTARRKARHPRFARRRPALRPHLLAGR